MGRRFTTDDVAARERLDYWREAICDVFVKLDCRSAQRRGFYGHMTSETLDRVQLSLVAADAQHVLRGTRQLAKSNEDDFLLSVQLDGVGLVRQDGRDALLEPGSMALYASTRPYELIFPKKFRQLVLQLPRSILSDALAGPDALTAYALTPASAEARLLGTTLRALQDEAGALVDGSRAHVATSVVQSLAAALSTLPQARPVRGDEAHAGTRARICAYVEAHLEEPTLCATTIAAALGFSRQHLYRLFAGGNDSLERHVWRRRVERVRADLENPAFAGVPLRELAARRGFTSPEHFSRVFRAEYGSTATAVRHALREVQIP
jgi:AraC-like DNA-binding protein